MNKPQTSFRGQVTVGIDRTKMRLLVLTILILVAFLALFSRLWFLQVLASDQYLVLAEENRVRRVHSEPPRGRILDRNGETLVENRVRRVHSEPARGRILDRNGETLVENRRSPAITIDRQTIDTPKEQRRTLRKLSRLLDVPKKELKTRLEDATVSPYKPVAVANDVPERVIFNILEHRDRFPGVDVEKLPIRKYPMGSLAAHVFGYVTEISEEDLASDHFRSATPPYAPGDLVGKAGLEYVYDGYLRGRPEARDVVVNSRSEVVGSYTVDKGRNGRDLILGLDADLQKVSERALHSGIMAARGAGYQAPTGGVVVMDPKTGEIRAMASFPTYDPSVLADGISNREWKALGNATPQNQDDQLYNRVTQGAFPPGSTYKVVTAGAAMWSGVATPYSYYSCPPALEFGNIVFRNWTSRDYGSMGFPESLEVSCDTYYYQLGWQMEQRYGAALGDGTEKFQKYMRRAGFGRETGIDLRYEADGVVPDRDWCIEGQKTISPDWCIGADWLPGYTVNMSIGQGDLTVTPLQMAVTFGAIANGGKVMRPRLATAVSVPDGEGNDNIIKKFKPKVVRKLGLDDTELSVIRSGLVDVISGDSGTAAYAFSGFPTNRYPLAGKTGTAQIGSADSGLNFAWFISYGPVDDPEYVISVYIERAGHGGESAGPVAREIWEYIAGVDRKTEVRLSQDASG